MIPPFFVTATGTDAGKTHILCALLAAALKRGHDPLALKPVLSGFNADDIATSDSARLLTALDCEATPETVAAITPWRFAAALSPDMAASRAGAALSLSDIAAFCGQAADGAPGPVFIEGAGGLMSPIAQDGLNLDLILALQARPILVCGTYLGAISHTLTAVEAMRGRWAPPARVILNPHPAGPVPPEETADALARFNVDVQVWTEDAADAVLDALKL